MFGVGSAAADFPRFTLRDAIGFLFFPVGVIVGLALAWRRELAGRAVATSPRLPRRGIAGFVIVASLSTGV